MKTSLGPHWQQPGRSILENHLVDVPSATDMLPDRFADFERVFFTGASSYILLSRWSLLKFALGSKPGEYYPSLPSTGPVILRRKMTWGDLQQYLRTWSSLHTYHEHYPEDLKRPEGDIATRFLKSLKDTAGVKDQDSVDIEWPLALILVRRS